MIKNLNEPVITINDLSFSYQSSENVLSGVSLVVNKGEMISIVGHNGSGKSTLAKLIAGILDYTSGSIQIYGIDTNSKEASSLRGKIGIVFQNPDNQFIGTSVEDDISFGLENKRVPREEMDPIIENVLQKVSMLEYREREPIQLSGGQKQRVAIAGVLALDPDIIIMDESTSMLDPQGKREINEILLQIRKNNPNKTIIIITHDLEETIPTDRVIVMNHGKIILDGKPDDIYQNEVLLNSVGLSVPFYYRVLNDLRSKNMLKSNVRNINELVDLIVDIKALGGNKNEN